MPDIESTKRITSEARLSLLEVLIAMVISVGAGASLLAGLATSAAVRIDYTVRYDAIETVLGIADELRATPIDTVVGVWGPGGTSGNTFSVEGLDPDGGGVAGLITIITDETMTDDDVGVSIGMPRDLDGDGLATSVNVAQTAVALPVIVEASWGPAGARESFKIPVVLVR
jgi:hypothetical protein